ncbi:unnamed protein product [Cylindrotheca closterium]|uniref:Uncharacterized protein n=1 Tax=Cylindrotheca closterium TaxID=2856 RepID=A0AAD2CTF6_9STRA|nr:unnamed protein product [Cylindrotheca closterium]
MKPKQLRETREEYKAFTLNVFCQHIYQQVRAKKFNNYLNDERHKHKIHICKPKVGADDNTLAERLEALGLGPSHFALKTPGTGSLKRSPVQLELYNPNKKQRV